MTDEREAEGGERARLFAVARGSSGAVPTARREALRAGILAATAATAASASATAATPAASATATTTVAASTTGGAASATGISLSVATKAIIGGLVGVLVGGVIVGTATVFEAKPAAPSVPSALVTSLPSPVREAPSGPVTASPALSASSAPLAPSAAVTASPRGSTATAAIDRDVVKIDDDVPAPTAASAPAPAAAPVGSTLGEETLALREVSRALAEGKSDEALRLLDRPAAGGELGEERAAARIVALCKAGRRDQAEPLRAAFSASFPRSTQRDRIARACASHALE